MNVWIEERKDRTVGLSDDNRPAAVKYYQLTPKGKEIFENILKILKK
jgi:DNA-binding PadR family transcriptional regulator